MTVSRQYGDVVVAAKIICKLVESKTTPQNGKRIFFTDITCAHCEECFYEEDKVVTGICECILHDKCVQKLK